MWQASFLKRVWVLTGWCLLMACGGAAPLPRPDSPTAVSAAWLTRPPTPFVTPSPEQGMVPAVSTRATATPLPPAPDAWTLTVDTAVPADLREAVRAVVAQNPARFSWVESGEADVTVTTGGAPLTRWVYALAAPFLTVPDGLTLTELTTGWQTGANSLGTLVVTPETAAALASVLGETPGLPPTGTLRAAVWEKRPSWTLLPFHQLTPDLKVLTVDGASPLNSDFGSTRYPLVVDFGLVGEETAVADFLAHWDGSPANYDAAKITRVAMTGVTALVRATASQMEISGITWPGEEVAEVLRAADIAHVSNEVSFTPDCPYPNPIGGTSFCSREKYFDLLTYIGTDVVELTGNHVNDYGADAFEHTLDLYDAAGLATFGGGRNRTAAVEPAIFTHNGNHIAFVGCNDFGPAGAWATDLRAGSRMCDEEMLAQIAQLRAGGHVVIATLQYAEFYHYQPTGQQQADFRRLVDAGATAVSGSQGHHAQGFDLYGDGFIHYGLGNLFFDQMDWLGTRQTFVDTYIIYDGRLLSVQLWTGLIENYARPRLMTAAERAQALTAVFQASSWQPAQLEEQP